MDHEFWRQRWRDNELAWHKGEAHPHLVRHLHWLAPRAPSAILVPLCGKSLDLAWLARRGHRPLGIELVEDAARQLFAEAGIEPEAASEIGASGISVEARRRQGATRARTPPYVTEEQRRRRRWIGRGTPRGFSRRPLQRSPGVYRGGGIEVRVGDFLAMRGAELGAPFDAVWDRAALVAVPPALRRPYVDKILELAAGGRMLLSTFEYDESLDIAPPYSLTEHDVRALFPSSAIECIERAEAPGPPALGGRPWTVAAYAIEL